MENKKLGDIYKPATTKAYYKIFGDEIECHSESDRFFLDQVPETLKGKVALDLGAGNGKYSELLHNKGAEHVIAFDLSKSMLDQVRERKDKKSLDRINVVQGDIEYLPFEEKEVDYILARFIVMYAADLSALIGKLTAILKDDGEMLIQANFTTIKYPVLEKEIERVPVPLNLKIAGNSVAIKNYPNTLHNYLSAFTKAGLTVKEIQHFKADELSVDESHPYAETMTFQYIIFQLKKRI